MPIALLSSYQHTGELAEFARALVKKGWVVRATSGTSKFLSEAGVPDIQDLPLHELWHNDVILNEEAQINLISPPGETDRAIDLVVVDFRPVENIVRREDLGDRLPVFANAARAAMVMCATIGNRAVVTNLYDLPRVLGWIETDTLNGPNRRWLHAKAWATLAARTMELAKYLSYGTGPSGIVLASGIPDPDSEVWMSAFERAHQATPARS
ncbi:MAG: hypothetical protein V1907_00760 [Candidatus Kerfeldbacteria bacterium]